MKRVICVILAVCLCVLLCTGCGNKAKVENGKILTPSEEFTKLFNKNLNKDYEKLGEFSTWKPERYPKWFEKDFSSVNRGVDFSFVLRDGTDEIAAIYLSSFRHEEIREYTAALLKTLGEDKETIEDILNEMEKNVHSSFLRESRGLTYSLGDTISHVYTSEWVEHLKSDGSSL